MPFISNYRPDTPSRSKKRFGTALIFVIAAVIAAGFVLLTIQPKSENEGLEGRVVEGSEAMQAVGNGTPPQTSPGGFRLCNQTANNVGVAVGYKDFDGWATEGWWNLPPETCETLIAGKLVSRFYYVYAIDYEQGGEWKGRNEMCTFPRAFTIRGIGNCEERGFETTGYFEIDTGEQMSWTVQLTEPTQQGNGAQ